MTDDQDFNKGEDVKKGKDQISSSVGGVCSNPYAYYLTIGSERSCQDQLQIYFSR